MSNVERVSLEELKNIANEVRKAGGGNPIDALIPAVPEAPSMCLIAKNLNFNCEVSAADYQGCQLVETAEDIEKYSVEPWCMRVPTREIARRISKALNWKWYDAAKYALFSSEKDRLLSGKANRWAIMLPISVGQVAADFDNAATLWYEVESSCLEYNSDSSAALNKAAMQDYVLNNFSAKERQLLREMLPYIEEAAHEAYALARMIHPDGSISI